MGLSLASAKSDLDLSQDIMSCLIGIRIGTCFCVKEFCTLSKKVTSKLSIVSSLFSDLTGLITTRSIVVPEFEAVD